MKSFLFSFLAILFTGTAFSQSSLPKAPGRTAFYAELGGPGILFSANIDHRFKPSNLGWGGRIGLGFVTADKEIPPATPGGYYDYRPASVVTVPLQVNYIFGKPSSPHTFEAGAGLTYVGQQLNIVNFYGDKKSNLFGTFCFMYRRQPVDGGFMWRIGFTPLVAKGYIQPLGAVAVGYSF